MIKAAGGALTSCWKTSAGEKLIFVFYQVKTFISHTVEKNRIMRNVCKEDNFYFTLMFVYSIEFYRIGQEDYPENGFSNDDFSISKQFLLYQALTLQICFELLYTLAEQDLSFLAAPVVSFLIILLHLSIFLTQLCHFSSATYQFPFSLCFASFHSCLILLNISSSHVCLIVSTASYQADFCKLSLVFLWQRF